MTKSLEGEEAEKIAPLDTLRRTHWSRVKAAQALAIDYKTLRLKIRRYGLTSSDESTLPLTPTSNRTGT
ncbi:MAG: hypothetical protein HY207_01180 [Nitrospirae bacterium]|nr:hypothetical protein [Nitrospirota bacterium]